MNKPRRFTIYAGADLECGGGLLLLPAKGGNSLPRHLLWRVGQAVKTPPFHGGNMGSTPVHATICRVGETGRHSGFKTRRLQKRMGSNPIPGTTIQERGISPP